MTFTLFSKACAIWLLIAVLAVVNGVARENFLAPVLGGDIALPVSGLLLSAIVFVVTYSVFNWFGRQNGSVYWSIGLQWVLMTLAFEFLFGHYVAGKPWAEIVQVFNILKGELFLVALVVTFVSPWVVAKIKGVLR